MVSMDSALFSECNKFRESIGGAGNNPSASVDDDDDDDDDDCVLLVDDIPVFTIDDVDDCEAGAGVVSPLRQQTSRLQLCGDDKAMNAEDEISNENSVDICIHLSSDEESHEPPTKRNRWDMEVAPERDGCVCAIKYISAIEVKLIQELAKMKTLRTPSHDLENLWLTLTIAKLERFIAQPHICDYTSTVVRCNWCATDSRGPRIQEVFTKCEFLKLGGQLEKLLYLSSICYGAEECEWIMSKIAETRKCLSGLKKCFPHLNRTLAHT